MNRRALLLGLIALAMTISGAASAQAAAGPLYDVKASWGDTNLTPGGEGEFSLQVRNIGDGTAEEEMTITDELPEGVEVTNIAWNEQGFGDLTAFFPCTGVGTETATCTIPSGAAFFVPIIFPAQGVFAGPDGASPTGYAPQIFVDVAVEPGASGIGTNKATVTGGGAPSASDEDQVPFDETPSAFGLVPGSYQADAFDAEYPFGNRSRQAGGHPFEQRVDFDFNQRTGVNPGPVDETRYITSNGLVKDVEVTLPRGFIGNPEATPKCDPAQFATLGATEFESTACPSDTQIGYLTIWVKDGTADHGRGSFHLSRLSRVALYNLEPPKGQAVDIAFSAAVVQGHIYATLDPAQNYAIKTLTPNISSAVTVTGTEVTVWGVPGDPAHDKFRFYPKITEGKAAGAPWGSAPIHPFFTNPMDCGFDNGGTTIRVDSYSHPGDFTQAEEDPHPFNVTGCEDQRFRFKPEISMHPTSKAAGGPTGLDVNLEIPQRDDEVEDASDLYEASEDAKAIATPPLKKAVVTLPKGMTVSPSAAQGLATCTPAQISLGDDKPVSCPDASQFGTLTLHTPLLPIDEQPEGFVYVASQNDNFFHNFLTLYLVIQEPERGILVKLPGRVDLDPVTGQITTTFDDLPQLPSSDVQISVKGGLRAGLVNPQTCGKKTITADLYTWQDPQTAHPVTDSYEITQNPDGSPCHPNLSERPFDPDLSGGTVNNLAGAFSPMEIQMTRSDEDQELGAAEGTAPPGLLASLRGVGRCSDAQIAAAANPGRTGLEEIANPSCPASSQVGTVDAGAGVGQVLTYVKGKVYMAGPYKGAPLSGVAIVPAVAGPFDVGTIITRAPAYVNPKTAELRLVTDPLPQIFKGIPVRVRDIRVHLDRPDFTLNPTSCDPFSLTGTLFSTEGKRKVDATPFQAADCASLGFKPHLYTRLYGGTHRGAHPKFRGIFKARPGDANVSAAVVTLPRSEFLDQAHIRTVCTRVQFAADACPAGAIYGHAEASTPLLDEALSGPVYLRSSDHKLPDLVADLHGLIDVEVVGRIDSVRGGIRASFESVPDAPVDTFTIAMQGGKKGLLVNSRDICAHSYRIEARFEAQNGKRASLEPKLRARCGKGRKAKRHRGG